jgi:hypothetical protein
MKPLFSVLSITAVFILAACNNNSSKETTETKSEPASTTTPISNSETEKAATVNDIVSAYIKLKNSLAGDNGTDAATSAGEINKALTDLDESAFSQEQKKSYADLKDDIKEHAEHISANGSNIAHQREHFDLLSKDIIDLVKATGSSQSLYIDFCPMYNNKKGASWLSETKDIKNPFYGKEMPKCGIVKEEIKSKV